jgi:hydroxylamine reductase (hybrid-cluster protein)
VAEWLGVATTVEVDGKTLDRDIDEIAVEVGEKAMNEWGKAEGELLFLKRAPRPRYELWKKHGVLPRNIDREIVEIMHRTHIGVDQDYRNLIKQGTRAAIADGWGGSMLATELQDILFGTPTPVASEANLGVMKPDMVNIIIHGHEPVLSEMIVAVAGTREMQDYARSRGGKGIQLSGICCTANEILQRHGVPLCGTFLQQELAIITGACDAMVVDIMGSCVDNSRILLAATEVVNAGGLGHDISDLPAAGSAPEWMSEKAISIGHYFVASGVYTVFGVTLPVSGAPVFQKYLFEEFEKLYGGMWDLEVDPIRHARKMIAHIDKKRQALGIDRARARILVDMAARRALETA